MYLQHPSLRKGATNIIVNDRGHLDPDINRSTSSPWGSFVGTWQMKRKPVQLKTHNKLTAHLYCTTPPLGSVLSRQTPSARAGAFSKESEYQKSLHSQCLTPQNGPRPNSSDSNASWVIIDNFSNETPRVAMDSRPASEGSIIQPGASGSRTPSPSVLHNSPNGRSPSVISAIAEVSFPQTRTPTGSQQMASRQQSRMSYTSGSKSPLQQLNASLTAPQKTSQPPELSSPH